MSRAACFMFVAALMLLPALGSAATLDVAEDGADLVFTWDTGPDDLLRGTSPDNLLPWMVSVSSPLRVLGENSLRGEDAFYRLASGSNMAYRIERTFDVPDPVRPISYPVTLPERHAFTTAFDLLRRWPTLLEVIWTDGLQARFESATRRVDGNLIGDDEALPRHGGVWLEFMATTTLTFVGSSDDAYLGMTVDDFLGIPPLLAIPPDSRWLRGVEMLCGEQGVDWFDVDADGWPDECGTDTNGDTLPDTGLFAGDAVRLQRQVPPYDSVTVAGRGGGPGPDRLLGTPGFAAERGEALGVVPWPYPIVNYPFRPLRW